MLGNCDHSGFHSGVGKLARERGSIRFILVCDTCGAELREVHVEDYAPGPDRQTFDSAQRRRRGA
jgi:hypothetical protein